MGRNNYPQCQIDDMEPSTVHEIVGSLKELHDKGKPQTDEEIKQRIDEYFSFCQQSSIRPGIESLCLALHISRTTLFNWNNGTNCSVKCQEYVQSAKGFISAFIEQSMLGGKISPPSGIFLMKNWLGYKDAISIEEATRTTVKTTPARTPEEIAASYGMAGEWNKNELLTLPEPPED